MHRPMRPLSPRLVTLATVAAAAVLASTSACELFGLVACEEDEDCPESLPFCVEDLCAAEADDGRIAELGTHAELIARGGLYARLHALHLNEEVPA